jgi:hypothetical protein
MKFVHRLHCQDKLGEYWIDITDGKYHAWVKEFTNEVDRYGCDLDPLSIGHKFNTLKEAKTWIKLQIRDFECFHTKNL